MGGQAPVPVGAAEVGVAVGAQHRHPAGADPDHGGVERPAAQVVDQHGLLGARAGEVVVDRRRDRFRQDPDDVEPRDPAGVLGGLALAAAEVGRNGDDDLVDRPVRVGRGVGGELAEDERGDLLGCVDLAVELQ